MYLCAMIDVNTREIGEFSQWHRLLRKKKLNTPNRSWAYDLLVTSSEAFQYPPPPTPSWNQQKTQEDKQRTKGEWYILKRMVATFLMLLMRITCFIPQQEKSFIVVAKCHHAVQRVPVHFTKARLFENKTGGNFSRLPKYLRAWNRLYKGQ